MDSVGRIIIIMLSVILIIIVPLKYIAQTQGETADSLVSTLTTEFTDTARYQGYITTDMYHKYLESINQTGELYDVQMEVDHPITGKEAAEKTVGDEMPEFTTEAVSQKSMASKELPQYYAAPHTHMDACYVGHRHTDSCYGYCGKRDGQVTVGIHLPTSYDDWHTHGGYQWVVRVQCAKCNCLLFQFNLLDVTNSTEGNPDDLDSFWCNGTYYYINSSGQATMNWLSVYGTGYNRKDAPPGFDFDKTMNAIKKLTNTLAPYENPYGVTIPASVWCEVPYFAEGIPSVPWIYQGCPNCSYPPTKQLVCTKTQDETTICNQVVTAVTATNPTQSVYKGDNIISTATSTMLDGTNKTVSCTVSGYDSSKLGTQTVTLTYTGLVDTARKSGTKTCTVNVTVKSRIALTGITVVPSSQMVQRYSEPSFKVTATYSDGTSKQVTGYTVSGYNSALLGPQTATINYTEDSITKKADVFVMVTNLAITCPVCGTIYELDENDTDNGCPTCAGTIVSISASPEEITVSKGSDLNVTVTATFQNGSIGLINGWTSDFDSTVVGIGDVKIVYQGYVTFVTVNIIDNMICGICGLEYALNDDGTDAGCLNCKKEVVSISASPKDITVEKNSDLNITVIATYKDRHTEEVTDWSTNFVADTTGTFEVAIFYKKVVDKIYVTVQADGLITCPYCGQAYEFSDSPEGCPVCSETITGIEAQLRNGGTQVMCRSNLTLQIALIYKDTHRALTNTGWTITGYLPNTLGEQIITVYYGEFNTTLAIDVVENFSQITCPVCGALYYLNEDGTDPDCPYCLGETDKDNAVFYFEATYTNEILHLLYAEGIYYLQEGDYLTVIVTAAGKSARLKLENIFLDSESQEKRKQSYIFGGEVIT